MGEGSEKKVVSKPILILHKVILWHDNVHLDLAEHPSHQSDPATAVTAQGAKKKRIYVC